MPRKTINLTGTKEKIYDLDDMEAQKRTNSEKELTIQIWEYKNGEPANPPKPAVGQIWLSKKKDS